MSSRKYEENERETNETWVKRLDGAIGRLLDGEGASADELMRSAKDLYLRDGRRAMQESEANAAALTGGYASSWAESAGQQAYQDYLSRYAEAFPGLMDYAMERGTRRSAAGMPLTELKPTGNASSGSGRATRQSDDAQRLSAPKSASSQGSRGESADQDEEDGGLLPLTERLLSRPRDEERLRRVLYRMIR